MSGIFKAYDIRGKYPDELDETAAREIGGCYARLLKADRVVVGRDMRVSSPSLAEAFIDGALAAGTDITYIGMVTTPMLYYSIIRGGYGGGAMVTASHLPADINGFKLCREKAIPLSGDHGLPALERMVGEGRRAPAGGPERGKYRDMDYMGDYIRKLYGFVEKPRSLKIAVDSGNGMSGPELPLLFEKVPAWKYSAIYTEPDGAFPHHVANPLIPSTTADLQKKVTAEGSDIGVAFDGDADRCGFIDEKGRRISEDLVTALIAEFILAVEPGAAILYDLRSSRVVPETITRLGGRPVRSRVGHAFIKEKMREENAAFGGELSGHYYFREMGFTDNAMLAMIHLLNYLSMKKTPLSELVAPLEKYFSTGEINLRVGDKGKVFAALEQAYRDSKTDHLDGLTAEYDSWWFNLRASNTEPVVRLNLEANDVELMEDKKKEVIGVVSRADPSMAPAD